MVIQICMMCALSGAIYVVFPTLASRRLDPSGVIMPRGLRKLKALRTLGVVNITGSEKAILQDIRKLTQLHKLAVTGINQSNSEDVGSTLAVLIESLSMESTDELGLRGCLDGVSSPPKNMRSLKLEGPLVKLPEWIGGVKSLMKLVLGSTNASYRRVKPSCKSLASYQTWPSYASCGVHSMFLKSSFSLSIGRRSRI